MTVHITQHQTIPIKPKLLIQTCGLGNNLLCDIKEAHTFYKKNYILYELRCKCALLQYHDKSSSEDLTFWSQAAGR